MCNFGNLPAYGLRCERIAALSPVHGLPRFGALEVPKALLASLDLVDISREVALLLDDVRSFLNDSSESHLELIDLMVMMDLNAINLLMDTPDWPLSLSIWSHATGFGRPVGCEKTILCTPNHVSKKLIPQLLPIFITSSFQFQSSFDTHVMKISQLLDDICCSLASLSAIKRGSATADRGCVAPFD